MTITTMRETDVMVAVRPPKATEGKVLVVLKIGNDA